MSSAVERINAFNKTRLPDLVNRKYEVMAQNAFAFFRGTNHLFWEDLADASLTVTSPIIWSCGDLHLENFGSYKGDNRLVYFDINDFDDAVLAAAHMELLRFVCSLFIAFDSLDIDMQQAEKLAVLFIKKYRETLASGKAIYIERQTAAGILKDFLEDAENRNQRTIVKKKTVQKKQKIKVDVECGKHDKLPKKFRKVLIAHMQEWLKRDDASPYNYEIKDAAFRIAGCGSMGLKRYMFVLKSCNKNGPKYMLLDMKQAEEPAPQSYLKIPQPVFESHAHRIKEISVRMQNTAPALLSTTEFQGVPYIVQELQPEKDSLNFYLLKDRYKDMCRVIIDMATLTASAQLRSAGRQGSATADELIDFGNCEGLEKVLIEYATSYLKTIKTYYAEYLAARFEALSYPKL